MNAAEKADKFYRMSISLPLEEKSDDRTEASVPELERIAVLRDGGSIPDAINYARALAKMYPDFDLIPFMIGYIYYQEGQPEEALKVTLDALPRCLRKYRLYSVAGLAEFERDNLPEALVWWSRSAIAQASMADFQENDPFLHLAHAAKAIGAKDAAAALFTIGDAIEPDAPRLPQAQAERFEQLNKLWAKQPFTKVLSELVTRYLK